jgi:hypothetical protein
MDVDQALESQLRNIESTYGRSRGEWLETIRASGLSKHNEVVAYLKSEHGLKHGAAHRLSLWSRDADQAPPSFDAHLADLYTGAKAPLRPVHDRVIELLDSFGGDYEQAPKKGYVSLRRRRQFAMLQPSTKTRVDLGLVIDAAPPDPRLESAATFNALFTHRVRLAAPEDVDEQVADWLRAAYDAAD